MTKQSNQPLSRIGLIGKPASEAGLSTLKELYSELINFCPDLLVENETAALLPQCDPKKTATIDSIGKDAQLAVIVGGDGNMLGAARLLSLYDIGVIGVNRGNLGFLADLDPENAWQALKQVLEGFYSLENRFLLDAAVRRNNKQLRQGNAVNEVVLHSDQVAHMIEFEVFVDGKFVFSQRSDGLIISTPTGSTAYSLSAGGPILTPGIEAINLVPMFPHALSSRPIVVNAQSQIKIRVAPDNQPMHISCDGQNMLAVAPGDDIVIQRQQEPLSMVHPLSYDYYHVLRNKLNWGSRLF